MELKLIIERYQEAMNSIYRNVNQELKERIHSDLTSEQYGILQFILRHDPCTSTDIANGFAIGKSAVTAIIGRLDEKGLIRRIRDNKDRRVIYLYVTERGEEMVSYSDKELYSYIGKHLSNFQEEEVNTFIQSLERLANYMETEKGGQA